jgi:hypothetical protein
MKIVLEVVATNMETGHIAISQEQVELCIPLSKKKAVIDELAKTGAFTPIKVGPILIARSSKFSSMLFILEYLQRMRLMPTSSFYEVVNHCQEAFRTGLSNFPEV